MLVHVYAAAYPTDVAGLVLLDASHPDALSRFLAALSSHGKIGPQTLREFREGLALLTRNAEGVDWSVSADEARAAGSLGDKPLIVVTAGQFEPSQLMPWPPSLCRPFSLCLPRSFGVSLAPGSQCRTTLLGFQRTAST
jgi:pimeloyl-ACP methyl ester carboxylesterase